MPLPGDYPVDELLINGQVVVAEHVNRLARMANDLSDSVLLLEPTVQTVATDVDFTFTPTNANTTVFHTGTLTADRTVTLDTVGAVAGYKIGFTRSGGGAFNLNVGTGPLKALATGQWCEVIYNGSAWLLKSFGSL